MTENKIPPSAAEFALIERDDLLGKIAEQAREIDRLGNELNDSGDWDAKQIQVIHGLHDDIAALKAQQSAVVLPERKPVEPLEFNRTTADVEAIAHNACLDEVARLNQPASTQQPVWWQFFQDGEWHMGFKHPANHRAKPANPN